MMKKVLIATPCLDQKVDAYFVHSLCESIKLGLKHDIDIRCVFLANESILPMARNELFALSYKEKYDIMVFIDDDEYWDERYLIEIIQSPKEVVCLPVINKSDTKIGYNILSDLKDLDPIDGYYKTRKVGAGFLKLTKTVIEDLWESNSEVKFRNKTLRNICEYTYVEEEFVGEDITLSNKIIDLGYDIWVNPNHTVSHIGNKMYRGDFQKTV